MRRVISLWLPTFAIERRLRRRPDRHRFSHEPLALVAEAGGAVRLTAANGCAAAHGVRPGMAGAEARAILPTLGTLPADPAGDRRALIRLALWCDRYSPWVALDAAGDGGAALLLDASGVAHLFGGEAALLADLVRRLDHLGFAARVAFADDPGAAWAVARFGLGAAPWRVVPPGAAADALAPLPVAALRLAPEAVDALAAVGLRRIKDLLALPRAPLAARFGKAVAERLDAALGRVREPLSPLRPAPAHLARLAFAEPIGRPEDVAAACAHLAAELAGGLAHAQVGARRLALTLWRAGGGMVRIRLGTARPTRDAAHLARLFAERLDGVAYGFGFDAMTLAAPMVEPLPPDQPALDRIAPPAAGALLDRLGNRLGGRNIRRFAVHESHVPERATVALPAAAPPGRPARWPWQRPGAQPRPLRLIAPPEPIAVTAPFPDEPPLLFRWRRVLHRVARAEGPERISPEWWRGGTSETRDYYRVEDTAGRRFWLYREGKWRPGTRPAWFLHGVF